VVDPRWTETADLADLHLSLRPGSDIALLNAMLHVLWREDLIDQSFIAAHTSGWDALRAVIERYPPERAAALTGLSVDAVVTAALTFGRARAALALWSMGINQSHVGTDKNAAIINLHLATGQIGRPGAGPLSLTGQPNAMGGRETGGLAHLLPGYRRVADAGARAAVERHWAIPPGRIPATPGRSALDVFEGLAGGEVRAVWIMCTNPAPRCPTGRGRESASSGRSGNRSGRLPPDRDDTLRRRALARRPVAREGRRHDQLRAAAHVLAEARRAAGRGVA
jgi:anaerobic selenocysteine-containing dehydrogenase